MRCEWLIREGRQAVLLFFNGWGMDARPFRRMGSRRYDVLMFYDYREMTWPAMEALAGYRRRDLLAWSMGVWAAGQVWCAAQPARAWAINGTLNPINRRFGIAPPIVDATLERISRAGSRPFYRNMFTDQSGFDAFRALEPERGPEEQRDELIRLREAIAREPEAPSAHFDAALIGSRDIVIPAKNQIRFWKGRTECRIRTTGHFPFFLWDRWEDLIDECDHRQGSCPASVQEEARFLQSARDCPETDGGQLAGNRSARDWNTV